MISLRGVRVLYGRTIALDRVELDLVDGIVGLFGPNGSGKSTLLRLLAGFIRPTQGEVLAADRPIRIGDEAWRRIVGFAGHEPGLYAKLTVRENLELFARLYDAPTERAGELVDVLDLGTRFESRFEMLSAGLKRRVAVARALLHDPQVLLLDEPYANLDDDAAERVSHAITEWHRPDRVCLIATHGAKRVRAFADAGIVLKHGRVVSYRARTGLHSSEKIEAGGSLT